MAPPKAKGQKMALGEFLTDTSLGSWADEMEDAPLPSSGRGGYGGGDRSYSSAGAGGGGYADRGYSVREELPLPDKPPYTVHLGNMSFDATDGDIEMFFAECEITSVRIVEDKMDRKPKGFGYAEFATLVGLKKALELSGAQFQGRNIRVSVAEPQKDRPDAREFGDWTRKGPLPDIAGQGPRRNSERPSFGGDRAERGGFGERSAEKGGFGGERGGYEKAPEFGLGERGSSRRGPFEQGDGKVRDFGNWERKGPLTPTLPATAPVARNLDTRPDSKDGPRERKNSPAGWGEGRSQDGSRPPRREFADRPPPPERAPTAAEQDNQWRTKMRPDAPAATPKAAGSSPATSNKELSTPSSPSAAPAPAPLTSRPKLNLAKRTVSQAGPAEPSPKATTPSDSKASPFGAARPIDTSARDKEIEERLAQKKEDEAKAREEKRVADEKAKEDRRAAKDAERSEKFKERANGSSKDIREEEAGKYKILRRDTGEATTSNPENAEGVVTDDKSVKPKEIVRDTKQSGGESESPTTETLDAEGWSTVSKPQKGRKGGNAGSRALAS